MFLRRFPRTLCSLFRSIARVFPNGRANSSNLAAISDVDLSLGQLTNKSASEVKALLDSDPSLRQRVDQLINEAKKHLYNTITERRDSKDECSTDAATIRSFGLQRIVKEIVQSMKARLPTCNHLHNVVLRAFVMINDAQGIEETLHDISADGLAPDLNTYNLLIEYYKSTGRPQECERLLDQMIKSGVDPDHVTYSTLCSAFCSPNAAAFLRVDGLPQAEKYFELALQAYERRSKPGHIIQVFNSLLEVYFRRGLTSKVHPLMTRMKEHGQVPNVVTFKLVAKSLVEKGMYGDGWRIFMEQIVPMDGLRSQDYDEMLYAFLPHMENPDKDLFEIMDLMVSRFRVVNVSPLQAAIRCTFLRADEDLCLRLISRYLVPNVGAHSRWLKDNLSDFSSQGWDRAAKMLKEAFNDTK